MKTKREILEKIERIILFLVECRVDSEKDSDWWDFDGALWSVRSARREVLHG